MEKRTWILSRTHTNKPELDRQDVCSEEELILIMPFIKTLIRQKGFRSLHVTIGITNYSIRELPE